MSAPVLQPLTARDALFLLVFFTIFALSSHAGEAGQWQESNGGAPVFLVASSVLDIYSFIPSFLHYFFLLVLESLRAWTRTAGSGGASLFLVASRDGEDTNDHYFITLLKVCLMGLRIMALLRLRQRSAHVKKKNLFPGESSGLIVQVAA